MKPLNRFAVYAVLSIMPAALVITCTDDQHIANNATGSETTTANIIGKIRSNDGMPVKGVPIELIPADFKPYTSSGTTTIDSTITDVNGTYTFILKSSGFFNVSAQSGGKYCYEDSVYGSKENRIMLPDDTLKAPGSIAGIAQLQPGGDNRGIVILLLGTNTYAMTGDSTGSFFIPALAEGDYLMRVLTTEKGYGIFDTAVQVASGETTSLPGILRLRFEGVPAIGPVMVEYDAHMMHVKLSWPPCDTSNVSCLYVFRNTGIADKPYATLDKTKTSFEEDVIMLDPDSMEYGDTLRYSVAACGEDRSIGRVGVAPEILKGSALMPIDTLVLKNFFEAHRLNPPGDFIVDKNHDIYFCGNGWISRVDLTGRECANYCDDGHCANDTENVEFAASMKIDANGNVLYWYYGNKKTIKFSADLRPDDTLTANDSLHIIYCSNGMFYTAADERWSANVSTLAGATGGSISCQCMLDDTLFFCAFNALERWTVFKAWGIDFGQLRRWDIGGIVKDALPVQKDSLVVFKVGCTQNGMKVLSLFNFLSGNKCEIFFLLIDPENRLIGRSRLRYDRWNERYAFDGIDRIYTESGQRIIIYKIDW